MTYGLIGKTLSHSYSKQIHELLGRYEYDLLPMEENEVEPFIANRRFNGLNVTIPYKQTVLPLCDCLTEEAREIGAVNTLYFDAKGRLWGANTDYDGFLYMTRRAGISFAGKKVLVLGDGGASLAVRKAALDQGAAAVFIASRRSGAPDLSQPGLYFLGYDHLAACGDAEVIVNTTPVGTYPANGQYLIDLAGFPACTGVLDLIYNPFLTDLLFQARERGIACSNGLPMLVAQATKAAGLFLGDGTDFEAENERILQVLAAGLHNIVLIGMPGSGKTTVGRLLAQRLDRPLVDLDAAVEQEAELSVPEIFKQYGETAFRDLETAFARDYGKKRGLIISAGGGIILKQENMRYLKQNGLVFFLDRPLSALAGADLTGRPLVKDIFSLKSLYEKRILLYNKYSDYVIKDCGSPEGTAEEIAKLLAGVPQQA